MNVDADIAIVGMACRFPGAKDLEQFWQNLERGIESIRTLSDEELVAAGVSQKTLSRSDYVKRAALLEEPDFFDAAFFGYSPSEAAAIDPQQRLLLELSHAALEHAGCDPEKFSGRIGVFAGSALNTYRLGENMKDAIAEDYIPTLISSDKDFLATRISYKLGLRGPSLTVQTACSTSLVAVHLARQSLLDGEADVALAGAVSIRFPHASGYLSDGGGVVSPDGHVRAFDSRANGTVFGSGAGVVVLKRLEDALAQGDRICAVIKGSAVNNDGSDKAGYTAPSVNGQADAVVEALANAGIDAGKVSYVEAHGSGTPVGDRIELLALTKAFRQFTERKGFCAIGSVKTNVGHLDAAAGMAGLIKTVLSLQHRRIAPTLHYSSPSEESTLTDSPFFVSNQPIDWRTGGEPRRAGVMATGMGGTNAHVVLEEAPEVAPSVHSQGPWILPLSAKTPKALNECAAQLADFLEARSEVSLADVARTLQRGRRFYSQRRFVISQRREDAIGALMTQGEPRSGVGVVSPQGPPPVVFLLPGVGGHYVDMGRGLYDRYAIFRKELDSCAEFLHPLIGCDFREILYSSVSRGHVTRAKGIDLRQMLGRSAERPEYAVDGRLDQTLFCQPALFSVEYALAQLWASWGVVPQRIVGHSMGEYVAACLSGVFSVQDALRLVAGRARLVSSLPPAAMLAVMLSEHELLPLLVGTLSLCLVNGPSLCVVAGTRSEIEAFEAELKRRSVVSRPVRNGHPFHSRLLQPVADAYREMVKRVKFGRPTIPFVSNVTGKWITDQQAQDPEYWVRHLVCTSRFDEALESLWKFADSAMLEVGPGRTLGVLAQQHPARPAASQRLIFSSLRPAYDQQDDVDYFLGAVGHLWSHGASINWKQADPASPLHPIDLPAYPFERQRHSLLEQHRGAPGIRYSRGLRRSDISEWFYVPSWRREVLSGRTESLSSRPRELWIVIGGLPDFASRIQAILRQSGLSTASIAFGGAYLRRESTAFEVRPAHLGDYIEVFRAVQLSTYQGLNVVHLGGVADYSGALSVERSKASEDLGFFSLLDTALGIEEVGFKGPVGLGIVTAQMHEVTGDESLSPDFCTVLGAASVLSKEYPRLTAFAVDLPGVPADRELAQRWAIALIDEFQAPKKGGIYAYRGRYRWERFMQQKTLSALGADNQDRSSHTAGFRPKGVYLITGGTGGIGLIVAKFIAKTCKAHLILTKRTPFIPKKEWKNPLASKGLSESDAGVLSGLLEIEASGGSVEVVACDVTDPQATKQLMEQVLGSHQTLHGVIHAAGVINDGLISAKSKASAEAVLEPKVTGTIILFDLIKNLDLDFFVLFSSLASVAPFPGQSDYSAANAFLDGFAHYAKSASRFRTVVINWPIWKEVGMMARFKALAGLEKREEEALQRAISNEEGIDILRRILASRLTQVVVTPLAIETVIAQSEETLEASLANEAASEPTTAAAFDTGGGSLDQVEKALEEIWGRVLGINQIGRDASFLDLGGHSLMAMQVVSQVRTVFQVELTLRRFFETPTLAGLARVIRDEIVAEIEGLTEEEALQRSAKECLPATG